MRILIKDNSTLAIIESSIIFCNEALNPCENVIVCLLDAKGDYWVSENIPIKEYELALTKGLVNGYINFSKYRFAVSPWKPVRTRKNNINTSEEKNTKNHIY